MGRVGAIGRVGLSLLPVMRSSGNETSVRLWTPRYREREKRAGGGGRERGKVTKWKKGGERRDEEAVVNKKNEGGSMGGGECFGTGLQNNESRMGAQLGSVGIGRHGIGRKWGA